MDNNIDIRGWVSAQLALEGAKFNINRELKNGYNKYGCVEFDNAISLYISNLMYCNTELKGE